MTRFVKSETVHFVGDGRDHLHRRVLVNGKEIAKPLYADTKKGRVIAFADPLRQHKYKYYPVRKTYRGKVEVLIG